MQSINYKIFSSIKPNLNFFVKLFGLTNFFYFFQNRFWLGIKHFSNPNESVHSELLHIFPPTCSAVLIGICQSLRKDDSCSSALAIYCTIIIYLGSTRITGSVILFILTKFILKFFIMTFFILYSKNKPDWKYCFQFLK